MKRRRLVSLLSCLVLVCLYVPHSWGQVGSGLKVPGPDTGGGHLTELIEAFARLADAGVVLANDDSSAVLVSGNENDNGGDSGNDNGAVNDNGGDSGNDNGAVNDNGSDDGNDNGSVNDNGGEDGNNNGNDNSDDNGNDNGSDNGNDNGSGNDNGDDNGNDNGNNNGSGNDNGDSFVADEVVVEVAKGADPEAVAQRNDLTVLDQLDQTRTFRMGIPAGTTVTEILDRLAGDPDVQETEPNFILQTPEVGTDTRTIVFIDTRTIVFIDGSSPSDYFDQEAIARIRADEAHDISTGKGVVVAVIDTGIDRMHSALKDRLALPPSNADIVDFVDNDADPSEEGEGSPGFGHGTFVAGIISLVAPGAKIMPLRAFDPDGRGTVFNIAKAITYAAKHGALVINMSFGTDQRSFVLDAATRDAWRRYGVLSVASAGNGGAEIEQYPASNARVLAVAATDGSDRLADFSNYGAFIDVCAPGVGVYSTYPGDQYGWWSGTSFSAPFVAGEAALLFATIPGHDRPLPFFRRNNSNRVMQAIEDTAVSIESNQPLEFEGKVGQGRIDVFEAVTSIIRPR